MGCQILLIFVGLWDSTLLLLKQCDLGSDSKLVVCFRDPCRSSPAWMALLLKQQWWVHCIVLINEYIDYFSTVFMFLTWPVLTVSNPKVQFDRYLSSPDTLVMPQLNFLLSAAIKWVFLLNVAPTVWERKVSIRYQHQPFTACQGVSTE